jgi:U6 snRNA-associated Sm-like protein LSm3
MSEEPFKLVHAMLNRVVKVKMRHNRSLTGNLVAYDDHLNMMLSDAQETVIDQHGNSDINKL